MYAMIVIHLLMAVLLQWFSVEKTVITVV